MSANISVHVLLHGGKTLQGFCLHVCPYSGKCSNRMNLFRHKKEDSYMPGLVARVHRKHPFRILYQDYE